MFLLCFGVTNIPCWKWLKTGVWKNITYNKLNSGNIMDYTAIHKYIHASAHTQTYIRSKLLHIGTHNS